MDRTMVVFKCNQCSIIQFGNSICTMDGSAMNPFDLSNIKKLDLALHENNSDKLNDNKRNKNKCEPESIEGMDQDEMDRIDEPTRQAVRETLNDLINKTEQLVTQDTQHPQQQEKYQQHQQQSDQQPNSLPSIHIDSQRPQPQRTTPRPNSVNKKVNDVSFILESSRANIFDLK